MSRFSRTLVSIHIPANTAFIRKIITRRVGTQPLLTWVTRKITESQLADGVCVFSHEDYTEELSVHVPADIPIVGYQTEDDLKGFVHKLHQFQVEGTVLVRADNVFVDPEFIDRLIITATENSTYDYIGYCSKERKLGSPPGMQPFSEWCSLKALRTVESKKLPVNQRNHYTSYIQEHPEFFEQRWLEAPIDLDIEAINRLISHDNDWEQVQSFYDAIGDDLDWHHVAEFLQNKLETEESKLTQSQAANRR